MIDTSKTKPEECESCEFETENLKPYQNMSALGINPSTKESHKWLCVLCASTMAGPAAEYPRQFYEGRSGDVLKAICYVGNAIIAEIRKART